MLRPIVESDWKIFRQLRAIALERFCERLLSDVNRLASDTDKSFHERYLAVSNLVYSRSREMARTFDTPRRSAALLQLTVIQSHKLLTEEEFARFGAETRETVNRFLGVEEDTNGEMGVGG
jgi:hypothetical protein